MDIFSTNVLAGVVEQIVPEYGFLTRTFFPGVQQSIDNEEIHFDVRKKSLRISPFVSPYVEGQIVEKQGYSTKSLRPAYIKDKRVFEPNTLFTRTFGEPIMGNMSPKARLEKQVGEETADQLAMLNRRLEVMAGEILAHGTLTIVGEKYPLVELDFLRDAALDVALSGAGEWGDAGVNPLASLETWSQLVFTKSGIRPRKVIMTPDAYALFRASAAVTAIFERFRSNNTMQDEPINGDDGWYAGYIGGFDIFIYAGQYVDPMDNTAKNILPAYSAIVVGDGMDIKGYKAYGSIRDVDVLVSKPYHVKSWTTEDPSVRYVMLQSAPILCPLYPDAMLAATVKV